MKNKILFALIIIMSIILISNFNMAYAADVATISLSTDKTSVKAGGEFSIEIKLADINFGEGITGLEGTLNWDSTKIEPLSESNQELTLNNWTTTFNNENGKIVVERINYATEDQIIAKIKFKVKENITFDKSEISLTNIVVTNILDESNVTDAKTEIKASNNAETPNDPNNQDNPNNTDNPNNSNGPNNQNNPNNSKDPNGSNNNEENKGENDNTADKTDNGANNTGDKATNENNSNNGNNGSATSTTTNNNSASKNSMPYTGVNEVRGLILIIAIAMAIISYKKYQKYKGIK